MTDNYDETIARTLATEGGHLFIGRGGFSLHYECGWLSGDDCEPVKDAAIAARLPVIDSRKIDFAKVAELALGGPMIAVGKPADPPPWNALSYAPLVVRRCDLCARWRRCAERACVRRQGTPGLRARGPFGLFDGGEGEREAFTRPSRSSGTWRRLF